MWSALIHNPMVTFDDWLNSIWNVLAERTRGRKTKRTIRRKKKHSMFCFFFYEIHLYPPQPSTFDLRAALWSPQPGVIKVRWARCAREPDTPCTLSQHTGSWRYTELPNRSNRVTWHSIKYKTPSLMSHRCETSSCIRHTIVKWPT